MSDPIRLHDAPRSQLAAGTGTSLLAGPTAKAEAIGASEMAAAISGFDWSTTPLGSADGWPQSLKSAVRLMLGSRYPMFVWWGPELTAVYNDAYCEVLGPRHPWALGRSARDIWAEIWHVIGPQTQAVLHQGTSTWNDRVLLVMERKGWPEETYFTFSYSPCFNDQGEVGGVFCTCTEDTARVLGERRLQSLRSLSSGVLDSQSAIETCERAARALATNPHDLPFVLLYLQQGGRRARLVACAGADAGSALAPADVALDGRLPLWPFGEAARTRQPRLVQRIDAVEALAAGPWPEPVREALVLPLPATTPGEPAGFLVAGLNPRRPLDAEYQDYLSLLAQQIGSAVADARSFEHQQQRAMTLAELDRAKTTFFSNVSHELRTPLALMLGPIAELLEEPSLDDACRLPLQVALRNGRRLQRLVNTLLDFSRIEAGRMQARFEAVDLAAFTAELASFFDSSARKAGLVLEVDCRPQPRPVYVDRSMWEKIVFNLLSNAIKYTPAGSVRVRLLPTAAGARLEVSDTGLGIPRAALPHVFERFYRVEGAPGRSIEGTGIGLALVAELARIHGATPRVESWLGAGSTFSLELPYGREHLPPDHVDDNPPLRATAANAGWLDEMETWFAAESPGDEAQAGPVHHLAEPDAPYAGAAQAPRGNVLLVDDNPDMRSYLARLISREHEVRTAADGWQALQCVAERLPDLVLTDVMMPRMDGFALLERLRAQPATATLPVIMLSAQAGEDTRLRALGAGADDFLLKPFHARELLARVAGTLRLAQVRHEAMHREQALRGEVEQVLESIGEGFIAVDAAWRFTYVNGAAEKIYGRSRESLLGRDYWEIFPDLAGSVFEEPFRRAMRERTALTVEGPYDPLAGWFEVSVCPVASGGLSLYFRDVLQSRLMERAVRNSEQRFREMAEAMPQIVYVLDALGRLEYVNGQWAAYTGHDGANTADLMAVVHPDDVPMLSERWQHGTRAGQPVTAEFRLLGADGLWRWFLTRAVPVRDDGGQVLRWYGTSTDVDASRRNAEALAQAHAALQQVERRKDQFIATLAHELRNPLAPLRNGVQLLSLGGGPDGGARVQAMMRRQIDHLVRLVDDLLEVSRITSGKVVLQRSRLELADVLYGAAESSRPVIETARHSLHVDVDGLLGRAVDGDGMRLGQVFANLLHNAAKYTEPGGHITLRGWCEGDDAVVHVQDNGLGLAADMLEEVFQPFVQVDRSASRAQGGLGIGLSIVRSLVDLHGGRVRAHSDGPGRGSTFEVRLPLAGITDGHAPEAGGTVRAQSPGAPSVLVVDDNHDAADSLAYMLEMMGARTRVVYGGPDAVAAVEAEPPALVLLDIGMPGMDGYQVARRLASHPQRPRMLLVALTGWGQTEDRQRTREAGFDEHLVKPAEIDVLEALLARAAGGA
ncbi:MAG TPA: response regulator [Ramlibacter sp.]|uniref:response regulator n=1 Tax=Ramlibacter sp. TaxID=1917967 RepID=UPI002D320783|nr:response regulator [Ramlibacter sp.]HZY18043.1 response regulator [Ramlibacter sp.]